MRWRLKLAEYEYKVTYKSGKTNVNADALSRNPLSKEKILAIQNHSDSDSEPLFDAVRILPEETMHNVSSPSANVAPLIGEDINDLPSSPDKDRDKENLHASANRLSSFDDCSDTESDISKSDNDSIFQDTNPEYERKRPNIIVMRDNFSNRKDNLIIFTTQLGEPCDERACMLTQENINLEEIIP